LSHLHFDHAGGLLAAWDEGKAPALLFPNAKYLVGRECWGRATHPHPRDRASFIPELQPLLEASGRLEIVENEHSSTLGKSVRFSYSDGHTPGLMLSEISMTPSAMGRSPSATDRSPSAAKAMDGRERPMGRSPSAMGRSPSAAKAMDGRERPAKAMDGRERPAKAMDGGHGRP